MTAQDRKSPTDTDTIRTARLVLRPPGSGDADAITALANNWNVVRNLAVLPYPYRRQDAVSWIADTEGARATGATVLAVCLRDDTGTLIGICGCAAPQDTHADSLGYWFGEPFWGQGYATEAVRAMVTHILARHDHVEILRTSCHADNPASRRVLEKCGFAVAGEHMEHSLAQGRDVPGFVLMLNRSAVVTASGDKT